MLIVTEKSIDVLTPGDSETSCSINILFVVKTKLIMSVMIELMMKLPDDIFKHEMLPYLTLHDLGRLDNMCMNHQYRPQVQRCDFHGRW